MSQIKACDEITINTSVENVWNVLIDIPNYHRWWPKSVNLEVSNFNKEIVNTQFEARPLGGKSFSCRGMSIILKREIKLDYFEGIYRGDGVWSVQSEDSLLN